MEYTVSVQDSTTIVRYEGLQRVGIVWGCFQMAMLALVLVWAGWRFETWDTFLRAGLVALGLAAAFGASVGLRVARDRNLVLVANPDGLTISSARGVRSVSWAEIGEVRRIPVLNVVSLRDRQGQELIAIDGSATGCNELLQLIGAHSVSPAA